MRVKARDGKTYDVGPAPPLGSHPVRLGDQVVGSFVITPDETFVTVTNKTLASETLLVDIADRFVSKGGSPVGIL
jgi:hypothetical protein